MSIDLSVKPIEGVSDQFGYIDATGADVGLEQALLQPQLREVAYVMQTWIREVRAVGGSSGGLFDRRGFTVGDNPYDQMRIAKKAVREDDVVGGVAEVTEGLVFQQVKWESVDPDIADVFNQWAADVNLDGLLRQCHRELYTYSQMIVAMQWGTKTYTPRNRKYGDPEADMQAEANGSGAEAALPAGGPDMNGGSIPKRGRARRKKYRLVVPTAITLLDPTKVVPVGNVVFSPQRFAWSATKAETELWEQVTNGTAFDGTMSRLIEGRYIPSESEKLELQHFGIDYENLLLLNPDAVWRHTATKPGYERFPDVRMTSVFKLLDLKQQLLSADRVTLVGAANYILLVKKGDKDRPGTPNEIANLQENFKVLAKLPIIVSDHRLEIEIVTPKVDFTLDAQKYDTIDRRLLSRLLGSLTASSTGQRNESTLTVAKMVARLLESRRWMLKRAFEREVARQIVARNKDELSEEPNLTYTPSRVELETQSEVLAAIQALNAKGDVSRQTMLETVGLDETQELQRKLEAKLSGADAVFGTHVPFDSPMNQPGGPGQPPNGPNGQPTGNQTGTNASRQQGPNGRQGGRPKGGGKPNQNSAGG